MLLSMFDQTSMGPDFRSEMAAAHIRSAASQRRELLQAGAVPGLPGRDIIAAYILTNRSVAWGVGILLIIFTIVSVRSFRVGNNVLGCTFLLILDARFSLFWMHVSPYFEIRSSP